MHYSKAGIKKTCTGACKREKDISEFYEDKGVCKPCFLAEKKLERRAKTQGLGDWYEENKKQTPKSARSSRRHG